MPPVNRHAHCHHGRHTGADELHDTALHNPSLWCHLTLLPKAWLLSNKGNDLNTHMWSYKTRLASPDVARQRQDALCTANNTLARMLLLQLFNQICVFLVRLIFFCSCSSPYMSASAVGGQPGTYMSTGTMRSHPRTTLYE